MAERFRNFYIDHVLRKQNVHADALASLVVSLALLAERQRKYSSTTMICTVQDLPSKTTKSQQENFKSKKL